MNEELYFKDAFTEVDGNINLDINNLNVNCITSKNNKFSLDSEGNLVVNSITSNISNDSNIDFDSIYPIGSIYFSVNNINPSTLFGGTWEQIKDRFLLASGNKYINGSAGGEETHTLTVSEMPKHCHNLDPFVDVRQGDGQTNSHSASLGSHLGGNVTKVNANVSYTGENQSHNNMPPYLVVCIWKRIS